MDRATSEVITAVIVVGTICLTLLTAYYISIRAKRHARQEESLDAEAVREELGAQIAALEERLDFAERVLAQQHEPGVLRSPEEQ